MLRKFPNYHLLLQHPKPKVPVQAINVNFQQHDLFVLVKIVQVNFIYCLHLTCYFFRQGKLLARERNFLDLLVMLKDCLSSL